MSIAEQIIAWVDHEWSLREFSEVTADEGRALKGHARAIEQMLTKAAPLVAPAGVPEPSRLFQLTPTTLHSGESSRWKIDCDALTDGDIATLADLIAEQVGPFSAVEGVPNGGLRLAEALRRYQTSHRPLLIVDDVLTTGASMDAQRAGREAIGAVIFARREPPSWVSALFQMPPLSAVGRLPALEALRLHRCKICGTRWLLWPNRIHGGGWNLLDRYQRPGGCCDNVAMGDQIEHLRDLPLAGLRADPAPRQLLEKKDDKRSRVETGATISGTRSTAKISNGDE